MILLDTCALLWLAYDQAKISTEVLEMINEAPVVYVSAISGFEIGIKYKTGKLILPLSPDEWFFRVIENHNLSILNLDVKICIRATQLPLIHKDPCDRFIIASAQENNLPIVTGDQKFSQYRVKTIL